MREIPPVEIMWKNGGLSVEVVSAKKYMLTEVERIAVMRDVRWRFAPTFA
jgi:hypothetical protein